MSRTTAALIDAVERLKDDNFETGPNWSSCHALCQSNEGSPDYDWVHGFVHLIEGDKSNASYWYRRAQKTPTSHELEREWQSILSALKQE